MRTDYLIGLIEKTSLLVILFLLISKLDIFKRIFEKDKYTKKDFFVISTIFTMLAIISPYNGIHYKGFILSTRIMSIVSGEVLFGPSAFLWIVFGTIFAGGVHDFLSGYLSLKNKGVSASELVGIYLG